CGRPILNSFAAWNMNFHLYHARGSTRRQLTGSLNEQPLLLKSLLTFLGVARRIMEPEPLIAAPPTNDSPSTVRFIFFNDRGLPAGWRIGIFMAMLVVFGAVVTWIASLVRGRARGGPPQSANLQPGPQLIAEVLSFLAIVFFTWVMSR